MIRECNNNKCWNSDYRYYRTNTDRIVSTDDLSNF